MDPNDRGVRKFRIAILAMGLVSLGYLACQPWQALAPLYPGFCMAVMTAAGIFSGTNILEKRAKPADPPAP